MFWAGERFWDNKHVRGMRHPSFGKAATGTVSITTASSHRKLLSPLLVECDLKTTKKCLR